MHVGFETLPDHSNCVADVVLRVEEKLLGENVQHFAIFGKLYAPRSFHRAANVLALDVARAASHSDSAAAIHSAHVRTCDADQRGFHRHADDGFRFLNRPANGTHREIEIHNLALAPTLRFGRAQGCEFHAAVITKFANQRAGFRAADVQRYDMPFLLRQIRSL